MDNDEEHSFGVTIESSGNPKAADNRSSKNASLDPNKSAEEPVS